MVQFADGSVCIKRKRALYSEEKNPIFKGKEPYIQRKRALYSKKALCSVVCRWIGVYQTKKSPIFREKEPYIPKGPIRCSMPMDRCASNEKETYIQRKRALYQKEKSPIFKKALYGAVCRWIGVHETKKTPIFWEKRDPYSKEKIPLFEGKEPDIREKRAPYIFKGKEPYMQRKGALYSTLSTGLFWLYQRDLFLYI